MSLIDSDAYFGSQYTCITGTRSQVQGHMRACAHTHARAHAGIHPRAETAGGNEGKSDKGRH